MERIRETLNAGRDELKGFAILWVVFFHARLGLDGFLYQVQRIGYGGVDLFFFLSGYGLYLSLEKDADVGRYLARRARRLLPAYVPFCLVWLAVMLPLYGAGTATAARIAAGNLFMLGFFADIPLLINWYVSALALTLLAAPLFHAVLRRKKALGDLALFAALLGLGLAFVSRDTYMAISRLPVFALGMVFARPAAREPKARSMAALLGASALTGLTALYLCLARFSDQTLCDYGLYWHPFILIAPALCAGLGWLFARCPAAISGSFALLGRASFEIFLFNVWLELAGKRYGLCETPAQWAAWSLAAMVAGVAYHALVQKAQKSKKSG